MTDRRSIHHRARARAAGLAGGALALVLASGPAFSQANGIAVSRAMWVVAPSPTLDITVELGQLCNGKAACQFVLAPATFGGKSPAGTGKHILLVQYRCGTAGKNGQGYDNETIVLSCP